MSEKIAVPEDLMDTDLPMSKIKRIIEIRKTKAAAERAKQPPSERVVAFANKRIAWAEEAEEAVKNGEDEPEEPKAKRGGAAKSEEF